MTVTRLDEIDAAVAKVRSTHLELTECKASVEIRGRLMSCGYREGDAIHDTFVDVARRMPLPTLVEEEHRHEYLPIGIGTCAEDEDDWPCPAVRLADAVDAAFGADR